MISDISLVTYKYLLMLYFDPNKYVSPAEKKISSEPHCFFIALNKLNKLYTVLGLRVLNLNRPNPITGSGAQNRLSRLGYRPMGTGELKGNHERKETRNRRIRYLDLHLRMSACAVVQAGQMQIGNFKITIELLRKFV